MIDGKTKQNLIEELAKGGSILFSCRKVGIERSTFYRWRHTDRLFRKESNKAIQEGRENANDICEASLLREAKNGKVEASKYILSHNSARYRRRNDEHDLILNKVHVLYQDACRREKNMQDIAAVAKANMKIVAEDMAQVAEEWRKLEIEKKRFQEEQARAKSNDII